MKKIIWLSILAIFATGITALLAFKTNESKHIPFIMNDYQEAWKKVDSLEQQGLPKSAQEAVEKIYEQAKSDDNAAQIVKTTVYKAKYKKQLEENGAVAGILLIEAELETSQFPVSAILQSVLGGLYQNYISENYWRFDDRTDVIDNLSTDIATWSLEQLQAKATQYYQASLTDEQLKRIKIEDFEAIVSSLNENAQYRPTLYDLLAFRALDYFSNDRTYLTAPANKFIIDDPKALADAAIFARTTFETTDETSLKYQTLQLYQEIIGFHLKAGNPDALLDADLKRLKFVFDNAIFGDKAALYVEALDELYKRNSNASRGGDVLYQKANYLYNIGSKYSPNPEDNNRWELKAAYELCETAIEQHKASDGAKHCESLKMQLEQQSLSIQTEQVLLPDQAFLIKTNYKNVDKVYLKVLKTNYEQWQSLRNLNPAAQLSKLNELKPLKTWEVSLPDQGDFQAHSTEIIGEGLEYGQYFLVASNDPEFKSNDETSYLYLGVSKIGFWQRTDNNNLPEFIVFDRATGAPMEDVEAAFMMQQYNRKERRNILKTVATLSTNKDGYVQPKIQDRYFQVKFRKGEDELFFGDGFSNYMRRSNYNETKIRTHFFTDRAIYRPGQTIYFKAVVLDYDAKDIPSIVTNRKVTVSFLDVNYQEVAQLDLITNEYGTINGSFIAPEGGLLGVMQLKSNQGNSQHSVQVEEYKRPKFKVAFEPVKESYKLDETVTVQGTAQAYAGNNIDGAKVQYRVVRETRYPWMPWWYRRYYNTGEKMEITSGTSETDAAGKFSIDFKAIPDHSIDATKKPEFSYRVYADVTDINGETRSSETVVKVGYVALEVQVNMSEKVEQNDFKVIPIKTTNLNGEYEPATGTVMVHQLKAPNKVFLKRYWQKPDETIIDEKTFRKNFPNLVYQEEDEMRNWALGNEIVNTAFDTDVNTDIAIQSSDFAAGSYVLTLKTQDRYGQKVELNKYFTVQNTDKQAFPTMELAWQQLDKPKYEPTETARFTVGSPREELMALFELEKDKKIVESKWIKVKELETLDIPITEADRGNFHIHLSYAQLNRSFNKSNQVIVLWSNKELQIEYQTFRDKLSPGEEEEWRIKISGPKGEKVAAEMVASLYDASLDAFAANNWNFSPYPIYNYAYRGWGGRHFNAVNGRSLNRYRSNYYRPLRRTYPSLNLFDYNRNYYAAYSSGDVMLEDQVVAMSAAPQPKGQVRTRSAKAMADTSAEAPMIQEVAEESIEGEEVTFSEKVKEFDKSSNSDFSNIQIRKNLDETVFFLPELRTDDEGNVIISFTMNEALTKWKFLGMAMTEDLKIGLTENEVVTQKELMVQPNAPRFMREGDQITFTAKVSNLTESVMNGSAQLELLDATSMQAVDGLFKLENAQLNFTAEAGQSARLAWTLDVPSVAQVPALVHRVVAKAGNYSDGEESALPILTNRMLVTETMPLPIRGRKQKDFVFTSLQNASASTTLEHQSLTLEFTSNPAWYAVQSLPYLMEYPYDCLEQTFNRYYANSLATTVANAHPRIKEVFDTWASTEAGAMQSNLSKNEELKYALLSETPWVLQAQSEEEQKRNIGLLFDLNRMAKEQQSAIDKLIERQSPNGGFAWFPGGRESWYMTQYLVEGFGHLKRLGVKDLNENPAVEQMLERAIEFIDAELKEYHSKIKDKEKYTIDAIAIHYLYARSFFLQQKMDKDLKRIVDYFLDHAEAHWLKRSIYEQGLIALALDRMDKSKTPKKIVKSLKQRAIKKNEMGMYWKYDYGYMWYQLPIETHALMIEVFDEIADDQKSVEDMKVWLLKTKQTTHWKTTKATAAAVYALLMNGDNWLLEDELVQVEFGKTGDPEIHASKIREAQQNAEVGTGYFKAQWAANEITPAMATVSVENPNKTVAWGGVYWQYFEQLDKINTFEETPLQLKKQLYKEVASSTGPKLEAINDQAQLTVGDKVVVRIELRVDRPMEYVHMKDTRASGFEPINVLSRYQWQGGLGYYESTGDAATNFFFGYLPTGTHVFEYPVRVAHAGDFSNGITTIQCMYAPEFTSHSEGVRVLVE